MKPAKKQALEERIAHLERKLFEAKSQYAATAGEAWEKLPKAANYHASGVILEITALGGAPVIPPVMIRDGLSQASVKALQADLCRSFSLATMVNPAMGADL